MLATRKSLLTKNMNACGSIKAKVKPSLPNGSSVYFYFSLNTKEKGHASFSLAAEVFSLMAKLGKAAAASTVWLFSFGSKNLVRGAKRVFLVFHEILSLDA